MDDFGSDGLVLFDRVGSRQQRDLAGQRGYRRGQNGAIQLPTGLRKIVDGVLRFAVEIKGHVSELEVHVDQGAVPFGNVANLQRQVAGDLSRTRSAARTDDADAT